MYVEELKNKAEWEAFLRASPYSTFYHSLKWKEVIQNAFHMSPLYLTIKDENGVMVGACPGFVTSFMRIKTYNSLPHSDYGGPVISGNHNTQTCLSLLSYLHEFGATNGVSLAKFRLTENAFEGFFKSPLSCIDKSQGAMEIDLKATPSDFIWKRILSRNSRKKVGQLERRGFQAQEARTKSDLRDFYDLYAKNMKHTGGSIYPFELMENMWTILHPDNLRIWLVEKEKRIGSMAVLRGLRKTYTVFVGIDRAKEYSKYDVHLYMRLKEVRKAEEEGCEYVSLGSTTSDPKGVHYIEKAGIGSSFHQQEIVSYPLGSIGCVFSQTKARTISAWGKSKEYLPTKLVRFVRKYGSRF